MCADPAARVVWVVAVTLSLSLYACGRSSPDHSTSATLPRAVAVKPVIAQPVRTGATTASMAPTTHPAESNHAPPPPWLAELLTDPDPQVRLQGLEAWGQHPGETLDAVTYALVDPDESVRERAQALFEEALARR